MKRYRIVFRESVSTGGAKIHDISAASWDTSGPWILFYDDQRSLVLSAKAELVIYFQDTTPREGKQA